jgi:sterol desaturase/sphingolipid hydroxylase (fatty acid hydroxylase superfamily)
VLEGDVRLVRPIGFALATAVALFLQWRRPYSRNAGSVRVNGGLWLMNVALTGTICGACVCGAADWAAAKQLGLWRWLALPPWLAVALTVPALDLVSYGWHRANHRVPFLWRWHRVHHSDPAFTVSTSLRFHPGELLLSLPLRLSAVVVLGAPVAGVLVFEVLFTLANAIVHGNIAAPKPVEDAASRLFVTPALHRWHHTVVAADRDRNFGTIFSVWDRLFRSFHPNDSFTVVRTGLPGLPQMPLGEALRLPLRAARH